MKNDASQGPASSAKRNIEAVYPLSPMQQGMLFHSLYAPETGAYFEQFTCVLRGRLNRTAFEQAWQIIVQRQAVLRTSFVWKRLDRMLQVVQKEVNLPVDYQDWRSESPQAQNDHLQAYLSADRKRGFDLAKGPLMRLALLQIDENAHYFAWSHHHALMDGWSMPLLLKEVLFCYETLAQGKSPYLPPARPYREYINWLQKQDPSGAEAYWRELLRGLEAPTHLIYDPFASEKSSNLEEEVHLSKELTTSLGVLARRERLTISTLIQAAWALLLSRYSGEQDVLFGATVSGRPADLAGAESIIGLFINTLPVRVPVPPDALLVEWLRQIQEQAVATRQFEYSALTQIQEWSEIPRGTPLFESILVFENYPVEDSLKSALPQPAGSGKEGGGAGEVGFAERLKIEQVRSYEQTNFPLTVVSGPGEALGIKISYDPGRFSSGTILRMLGHLERILAGFVSEMNLPAFSQRRLADISILTAEEEKVLDDFSQTVKFPEDWTPSATWLDPAASPDTIHHLFELQAELTPDAIALILDESAVLRSSLAATRLLQMTYSELNERADTLAGYLRQQGVGPEALVGIYTDRSFEMVIGILGILKAGGAYLPLDPNYPVERISFMLNDAAVALVLTQSHLLERLPDELRTAYGALAMDTEWEKIQQHGDNPSGNISPVANPQNLAYVIYTSGSTGKPKGVMIEHHSLVNLVRNNIAVTGLRPADKVLQFLSFGFDASGEELFPPLVCGASLVLPASAREIAPLDLCQVIERQQISTLHLPVAYWHQMVDELEAESRPVPACLRLLTAGGESPAIGKLRTWFRLCGDRPADFINAYGPTETTIAATYYRIRSNQQDRLAMDRLPIGHSLANNQIRILDMAFRPVPINVPGEICIAGAGVARGYLNQPELTAEKFIPALGSDLVNNLAKSGETRMYRTGDQGRFWPDGTIEFVGRVDQQVKIRGYRIELGEIEAILSHHPSVQSVAVLALDWQTPGNELSAAKSTKRLVAYIQPQKEADGLKENSGELRQYLLDYLPEYMVPAVFVFLESFPLTPNGKIDRRGLPIPEGSEIERSSAFVSPRTPVESLVAGVWEQVLGVSPVGAEDNFFELGGHSLVATQVVSRLRNVFQVEIPLRDVFENPTVAGLSSLIETNLREGAGLAQPVIDPLKRAEGSDLPFSPPQLSFSQQRLWFLDQLAPGNLFYNLPLAVEIGGALDIAALKQTIYEIVARHAILRTNFQAVGGVPVQIIHPPQPLDLPVTDLSSLPESEARAQTRQFAQEEARKSFDLQKDALVRARLFRLSDDRHVFLLTMHHIVSDGWSMGVFIREVAVLYAAFTGGKPSPLPPLRIQYFDYAEWQRYWLQGEQLDRQVNYWKKQLASAPRLLELPTDHPRPAVQSSRGATLAFSLPAVLNRKVNELCRQEGVTLFMAYLAAFQVLLSRYSGQEDISVGTAIANRTNAEIENLIGFFVNTLVMRVDLSAEPGFREVLKRVRDVALGAYAHQDLPFETLVEVLQPERNLSHTPLFQVAFALQNAPMSDAVRSLNQGRSDEGLNFELIESDSGSAKFDLTLTLAETPDGIVGGLEYNLDLFEPVTIERMVVHYQTLIENALADLECPVSQLGLLSQTEQQRLLVDWNASALPTPTEFCAHQLFETHARRNPDQIALDFEDLNLSVSRLTYAELNQRADQLARFLRILREEQPEGDFLVGISTERSPEMMVAILGVMKAGGAYVPLDPAYPEERLAYMLADAGILALLTQERLLDRLPLKDFVQQVICLDRDWPLIQDPPHSHSSNLSPQTSLTPDNLAYMIYTSGSTGRPKGTMLRHRGLSNLVGAQKIAFGITEHSRVLQFSPFSFDASVWETFMALGNGATLVLARQETLASSTDLLALLKKQAVTTVTLPPSVLGLPSAEDVSRQALPALQTVISAGEACTPEIVAAWSAGRDFFNAYGPTETTVCASMYRSTGDEMTQPPIGKPIANHHLYILDRNNQPVPVGVPGELHVSGVGLAVGYRNQPELTAEKFIPNPFGKLDNWSDRLYKTGDLARYREDGNIDFLGRIDQQVKVRGFRIELGEIEATLNRYPSIHEAVVLAQGQDLSDKRLAAFIVPEAGDTAISVTDLRSYLRKSLPEYMLPSGFMVLEKFPLSPSGKVDRKALAAMEILDRPDLKSEYIPPRNEIEQRLIEMCIELLHVERVGVFDNFFELGGHSLLATQFVSRVREEYAIEVPLRKLFENPTVAGIADFIASERQVSEARAQAGGTPAAAKSVDKAKLLEMLQKVGGLSDDEVRKMLEQKKRSE